MVSVKNWSVIRQLTLSILMDNYVLYINLAEKNIQIIMRIMRIGA